MKIRNLYPLSIFALLAMLFPHLGFAQNNEQTLFKAVSPEYPTGIVSAGNQFFFTTTYNNDSKIWKSDGTSANTQPFLINDADGRISSEIVPFNNSFYFVKVKNGSEMDLWKTDGTTKTRVDRLMTLIQGDFRSYELSLKDGKLLFKYAYTLNNVNQGYLLQSTGATGGTTMIGQTHINYPNYSINRRFFIGNNNTVFYQEDSTITATNLTSQGLFVKDALGTRRILNAQTGVSTPNIGAFSVLNNELYYTDNSTAGGNALWKINASGTKVKIKAGFSDANPISNIGAAGKIYFQTIGNALWRTDGTAAGTIQVAPFTIFPSSINGTIYYHTDNYTAKIVNDAEVIVGQFPPNHQHLGFININNQIHSAFTGNDNSGYKLFKPNAGQYDLIGYIYGYNTLGYAVIGNSLYYQAFDNRFPNVAHAIYQLNLTPSVFKPDLAIKQADINLINNNNQYLNVSANFKNIGALASGTYKVHFYISSDTLIGNDLYTEPFISTSFAVDSTQNATAGYNDFSTLFKLPKLGTYYVIVKLDVENSVSESNENNNIAYQSFTYGNSLCASKGTLPWEYWIGNVKFSLINNTSDKFKDFNTLGYSDYTNLTTTVSKGQSYPLSISPGLSWIGNVPNVYARAWIDFNNNNIFEANELVLEKNNANPLISNVLVPTTAVTGNVRMRVSVKFGNYPTACETFDKGEVEDYTVNITEATISCTPTNCPPNITVNTTTNSAIVTWTEPTLSGTACGGLVFIASIPPSTSRITSGATFPLGTSRVRYGVFNTSDGRLVDSSCHFDVTVARNSVNLPDLTLANLTIPTLSVQQGQDLPFKVDIKNIGTGIASGEVNVITYISKDNQLSSDDTPFFDIGVSDIAAGTTLPQTGGVSQINNLVAGQYYLILKVDAKNRIIESNENNNILVSSNMITITNASTCPPQYRAFPISNNTPCGTVNVDTLGGLGRFTIYQRSNNPTDGFDIVGYNGSLASSSSYVLYLRNGTTTPPSGLPIINCSNGAPANTWLYFTNVTGNIFNTTRGGCYCAPQIVTNGVIQVGIGAHGTGVDGFGVLVNALNGSNLTIPLAIRAYVSTPNCTNCLTDNVAPTLVCPKDTTIVTTQPTGSNFTYSYQIPTATDNCSPYVSVYGDTPLPTFIAVGATSTITYTAVDPNNNRSTCRFNVTISNNTNPTTYCASKGIAPWEYWVANVKLGTINNTSDKFKDFATLGYSDYTSLTTTLSKGQSYPLSISPGLSWIGNVPNAYVRAWIDFNNNKIFEANELVLEKTNANPLTANVLVPTTAVTGNVRMRVALKFGAYPTACETFDRGEVEDYTINIQEGNVDPCTNDVTPPVFSNCPQSASRTDIGGCFPFQWTPPTATDNCGTPTVMVRTKSGNSIRIESSPAQAYYTVCGTDSIFYTATDLRGNKSVCSFQLSAEDACKKPSPLPTILPSDTIFNSAASCVAFRWAVPGWNVVPCSKFGNYDYWTALPSSPVANIVRSFGSPLGIPALDSACFPIGTTTVNYRDFDGNTRSFKVTVVKQTTSSADLALSMTSTPSVFQKYTTQKFRITAQNVGNQALTNVKIEFKRPAQTSNGGAKVASIGTFNDFCPGGIECSEWIIPSLAAGATATLDAPVFILDPTTAITATTKLLSSTPVDGNAANNTASVTLTPAATPAIQSLSRQKPTQYLPIIVQSIAPNPTEGDVVIEVESLKEQVVQFDFSNTMGQIIRTEKRPLEKGTNQVKFDVYEFPDGVYFLQTDVNRGRVSPTKFVKF